ncbi:hypothetical protein KL867_13855 [Ruegeria litorea]|nr:MULTISPECIES: hypothetical protein [Roseobacteraceae]MBT3142147.1 hypothetical protein [Falsiruegeria litorea]
MTDFIGTENSVSVQRRLQDRQPMIAQTPGLVNGGRVLHCLDPDAVGWSVVHQLAGEDKLMGFPVIDHDLALSLIHDKLGPHWKTPVWHALLGSKEQVLAACSMVIESVPLATGWSVVHHSCPNAAQLEQVQALNAETGVAPYPAYYMRSEAVPVLTTCVYDGAGDLIATASVADRYHRDSRLAGHMFAGMVSVSETKRGRGLGKLVNALALVKSQVQFGWTVATEQVAADNVASRAMIMACGLTHDAGLVSVAAMNSDETFSR